MSYKDDLKEKRLALFFTLGISLRLWQEMGHLSRESRIYKHLAAHLGELYFLTYGSQDMDYASEIAPIEVLPKPRDIPIKLYSLLMPLIHWKVLKEVDFLKTNQMPGAWAAVLTKLLFRKKLIVRCGYEWELFAKEAGATRVKRSLIHLIEWIVYRFADAITLTSNEMKRYVCDTFKVAPEKITIIPNYVDTELFRPMNVEKVPGRLIFVGRLVEQKNLLNLFKVLNDLPDVELILVGKGPLKGKLEEYARTHGTRAIFQGRVPNDRLPPLINTAQAFVLPSLYEGNPKALLEAMACGLPVIATPVEGNQEVVSHQVNGYLSSGTGPEAIRKAIIEVLSDANLRETFGRQARAFIEENYGLDVLIQRELTLLESLSGR